MDKMTMKKEKYNGIATELWYLKIEIIEQIINNTTVYQIDHIDQL